MFPHPQNLITVLAMEREQALAEAERKRSFAPSLPRRSRAPKLSLLRRAARAVALLAG